MTVVFVLAALVLQVFVPYHRYVSFLKWLTLSLLAYAAVLFVVHVPWDQVVLRTFWPHLTLSPQAAMVAVGVFGTTISPNLFFWQASEEVEDMQNHDASRHLPGMAAWQAANSVASAGIRGVACSTPMPPPISSFWQLRSL